MDSLSRLTSLLQELIRNRCVNDGHHCNEAVSAASLKRFFSEYGIEAEIFSKKEGRDNLVVRIPGTDPDAPSLAFMGHLDVVPASPEDWKLDPFGGELAHGEVWGRGAVDMLNMTASQAVGFAEAVKKHGAFPGDLLYIALADEEASGKYGARWLTDHHWDKVSCDVMVSEIGGFYIQGRRGKHAVLGVGEKGVAWLRVITRGVPGHGSIPYGAKNAVDDLVSLSCKLAEASPRLRMGSIYRGMVKASSGNLAEALLLNTPLTQAAGLSRLAARNPGAAKWLHAASLTTVSTGMIQGGSKINIIPDTAYMDLDIRLVPGESLESAMALVHRAARSAGVDAELEVLEFFPPTISESEGPFFDASASLLKKNVEDAELLPILVGGATDGRFWRRKGTRVYGFTLFDKKMTMDRFSKLIHGRNERISLDSLALSLEYYTKLPGEFFAAWQAAQQ